MPRFLFLYGILYLLKRQVYSEEAAQSGNVTQYGNEGDTMILKCPLTPPAVSGRTTWRGPPSFTIYFLNTDKNPGALRRERLSVLENTASGAYNLRITNLTRGVDDGIFKCEVNTDPIKEHYVTLKFNVAVHNISLLPNSIPFSIIEGTTEQIKCEVNKNAAPPPNITWYLNLVGDIRRTPVGNAISINITGNRSDNSKTLECQATNNNNNTFKKASTVLNVEYPPSVNALSQQVIKEKGNISVTCQATPGNPNSTTLYWIKVDNSGFRQNGSTLLLPNIERNSSGTYRCIAENMYSNRMKGTDNQDMVVNVQYPPLVNVFSPQDIIEGRHLSVNCTATPGNPNSTTFYWIKVDNQGIRQNKQTLQLPNIQRNSAGNYRCTAENSYTNGGKGTDSQSLVVNVQYPPTVNAMLQQDIIEGTNLLLNCTITPGNPGSTTFYWTKEDNPGSIQDGSTLQILSIQRNNSGSYRCTAENKYSNGEKGKHSQAVVVNVQYQPTIENKPQAIVNESEKVFLSRNISSNPLSNASWYDGNNLLKTQVSARAANYILVRASCEDTKNFSLVVSNGIGSAVNTSVGLIVNCKPKPDSKNITLGVTDTTGIEFSSTVLAYPEPLYELIHENGTKNDQMMGSIIRNAINNFTYHFNQTVVNQDDYGTYHLVIQNDFGAETIYVNILPQMSPESASNIKVECEVTSARVQWISSFDGGDTQTFTVFVLNGLDKIIISDISDKGKNKVHDSYVEHLQPSSTYTFYVSAQNRRGNSSSERITCTTSKEDTGVSVPLIVGGAAAGGITLATIVIVIIFFLRRYTHTDKQAGNIQRLKQEDESENTNDDGLKDNILYISAGPKVDQSEAAVYAEVNKKGPESKNNANMYAEVKKGFSKNDVSHKNDPKPKQKKGKKKKSKQDVADVYENSDDIAMTSNMDNVYSNAQPKDQNKEERGYKNKDGLLYVEVKFDPTSDRGNPVIHGEDEKTDYATVDFPMPTTPHKVTGDDKI